jgi:hypothetical protein
MLSRFGWMACFGLVVSALWAAEPIALHPENPHYFLFRGKPTVLITSGEHYGAVLNLDFDYIPYLDELQSKGLNMTRLFAGTYREIPGSFDIRDNTLAPLTMRFLAPWARSETPGYFDGGNKFDLTKWDEAYFKRMKDFLEQAGKRGVVVELSLFCPNYDEKLWKANPMNVANNVNGIGDVPLKETYALKHQALTDVQDAFVRKIVGELKDVENLYYEICNEPYFGGVTLEWQAHIAATIVDAEKDFAHKHLLAQNISNGSKKITDVNPAVSIFNFHYCKPPDAVGLNYALNKPIAFDESGFRGSKDRPYRSEAWDFIVAGGAVYDNLDYSFSTKSPNGTAEISAPGAGGPVLREQYKILKTFIESFNFIKMSPDAKVVKSGVPGGSKVHVLSEAGKQYALFIHEPAPDKPKAGAPAPEKKEPASFELTLELPAGNYKIEWLNTLTGKVEKSEDFNHKGGEIKLASPPYSEEIAAKIVAK